MEGQVVPQKQPIWVKSATRIKLENKLRKLQVDEFIAYQILNPIAQMDVQREGYGMLRGAINTLAKEGIVIEVVRAEGVKRIDGSDVHDVSRNAFASVSRKAKRTATKLKAVNYGVLSQAEKNTHQSLCTIAALIGKTASTRTVEKVISCSPDERNNLIVESTIQAMKKGNDG